MISFTSATNTMIWSPAPKPSKASLLKDFPLEAHTIDTYLDMLNKVAGAMQGYTLSKALPRITLPVVSTSAEIHPARILQQTHV